MLGTLSTRRIYLHRQDKNLSIGWTQPAFFSIISLPQKSVYTLEEYTRIAAPTCTAPPLFLRQGTLAVLSVLPLLREGDSSVPLPAQSFCH